MKWGKRTARWLTNPKIRWGLVTGLWVLVVVTVVIPSWRSVRAKNDEIRDLETRLATMDDWTVAGMWLTETIKQRAVPVTIAFNKLFPDRRGRERLFLSLAQIADKSGVEDFNLSEANTSGMDGNDVWGDGSNVAQGEEPPPPGPDEMPTEGEESLLDLPTVDLTSYRVNARFSGDYQRIAQFMTDLKNINRALKVHSLVIRPERDGIQVDLELDVYVSKTSQS